ncbi:MAG: J domain-containing protein [Chitinophagaceae bacterium]
MDYKDYYKVLGLDKKAKPEDIKKAFRKLAVKHHPDKNPGDKKAEEKFKEINEANEVLGDLEKRKKYDELGENWQDYQQYGGGAASFNRRNKGQQFEGSFNAEDFAGTGQFSDFFENLFGETTRSSGRSRTRTKRTYRGEDQRAEMEITLEEALHGGSKQILLNGEKLNLKLKPGLREGQLLRMKGKGGSGMNTGEDGDLLVTILIAEHPRFKRKENDLYFDQEISLYTAVLGGKVSVQTIDKVIQMNVPAGTDSNKTFRLKGMGMNLKDNAETRGDAFVRMVISVPKNITEKEMELFTQLAKLQEMNKG